MSEERKVRNDIIAVLLLGAIVFLIASLATHNASDPAHQASAFLNKIYQPDQLEYPASREFTNACGRLGAWTADLLITTLGIGAYFLVIGLITMEISLFQRQNLQSPWTKTTGWVLSLLALTTLASTAIPGSLFSQLIGPGGYLGALGKGILSNSMGTVGSLIIASSTLVVGMMMWTEYMVFHAGRLMFAPAFMAATSVLPFGLIHRFASWFNGLSADQSVGYEDDIEFEDDVEDEDLPRTIRFRRRDLETEDETIEDHESDVAAESEIESPVDESEFEEGVEDEEDDESSSEFEDVEEDQAALKIVSETKEPEPTITEPVVEKAPVRKPHFKVRATQNKEPEVSEREIVMRELNEAVLEEDIADYELPSLEMLKKCDSVPFEKQKRDALKKAETLEKTCKQFGYDVKVVEIETGPVISQYEIELAPGLRLQKITALSDDLAIALRVPSVRIVAPIPGKNSVGVEVPNDTRQIVSLRQVMEQSDKQIRKMKIPLFLGSDAVGAPMVADLASLPHLLIAGRTGTGKSVCLNAIISSILMTRKPDEVRMLMIDPKMVELSGYGRLPHLMHPVVTDMRKAEAILAWAVDKMEERYALLARAGVRHVTSYNQLGREELMERIQPTTQEERDAIPNNLPFIVIIADEMADLMMTAGKEVQAHIIRLAQKSRAVGIHLILATQKPTVDVITGLIKSNLPARISFQVASKMDSRVVLDAQGAEKLLGMGDMLFLWPGTSTLLRGQGTYLSDEEIDSITATVSTGEQNFVNELINLKVKSDEDENDEEDAPKQLQKRDELYEEAISIVVKEQRGSCSLLQRAMGIGYGRAARLIDYMAEDGYVGPYNGSKAREVMLTEAQWDNILAGDPEPVNDEDWPEDEPVLESVVTEPPKVTPAPKKPSSANSSKQKKKLLRLEPGTTTHLSANTSFAPKRRKPKPVEEEILDDEVSDEDDYEDLDDDEAVVDSEIQDSDHHDDFDDEDYEDVDYDDEELEYEDYGYDEEE
ncbi:MAG: DNA translocase FtsK [Planctomycetota bacterium]